MSRKKNQRNKCYECVYCHGVFFWIYAQYIITALDKRKKDYMICPRPECMERATKELIPK